MSSSGIVDLAAQFAIVECDEHDSEYIVVPDLIQEECQKCFYTSPWMRIPTYIEPIYEAVRET